MINREDISALFSDLLDLIQDKNLRNQVIDVWVEGCRQGGWQDIESLKAMPFSLLTDVRGVNFIEHTIAVTRGALGLLEAQTETYHSMPYPVDRDILIAGGLLHDIGKLLEIEPDGDGGFRKSLNGKITRHPISGTVLAAQCGLDGIILNTIACHAKEGEGRPQCLETILIHQADYATFNPLVMLAAGKLITDTQEGA